MSSRSRISKRLHGSRRPTGALRRLFRAPEYLYRWKCGWLLGRRFLLLIHVGRRTGLRHHTVLEVLEYRKEGPDAVVMSAFGLTADRVLEEEEAMRVITGYEQRNWLIAPIIRWS